MHISDTKEMKTNYFKKEQHICHRSSILFTYLIISGDPVALSLTCARRVLYHRATWPLIFSLPVSLDFRKLYNNGFTSVQGHAFNGTKLDAV